MVADLVLAEAVDQARLDRKVLLQVLAHGSQPLRHAVGDEGLDVLLDRGAHVREHRGAARSRHGEQIRETGNTEAEQRARTRLPCVGEAHTVAPADVDPQQAAGHRVVAGGEHDRVELVTTLDRQHTTTLLRQVGWNGP